MTAVFFFLVFLAATQDIAVDGSLLLFRFGFLLPLVFIRSSSCLLFFNRLGYLYVVGGKSSSRFHVPGILRSSAPCFFF
jgi:hypothetical protein